MFRVRPDVEEWRIHIGAHKTATTHLQDTLAAERDRLCEEGVDVIRREDFRPLTRTLMSRRSLSRRIGGRVFELDLARRIRRFRGGAPRVVISDEDLLGTAAGPLAPVLYPGMEARVSVLNALARQASLTVFLSIRSFDRVLPGAYATVLRYQPEYAGVLGRVRDRVASDPPSWLPLIDRIAAALPGARLRIWRQEDYRRDPGAILNGVLGTAGIRFADLPPPEITRTPSAAAVAALEADARAAAGVARGDWAARSEAVLSRFHLGEGAPFRPFPERSVALMRERYAEDCDEIYRRHDGAMITPERGKPGPATV